MAQVDVYVPTNIEDISKVEKKSKKNFRDYNNAFDRVSRFYFENRKNQDFDAVMNKKNEILKLEKCEMSVWEAAELLNELIDESDPDTEFSQITHLLQTSEAIRKAYPEEKYDWFHLTGFIHDLGKVLSHPKMFNLPQWACVGDTFPVGCEFAETNVYPQFFENNADSKNPKYNTKYGIYSEGIGLDNVHMSFGHDEYMYQVCVQNGCLLPLQALYIIRYHSFYPWHQHGSYTHLTNETDREMLHWVKEFQKFDLYSKLPEKPNVEELIPYYKGLIAKYFPKEQIRW